MQITRLITRLLNSFPASASVLSIGRFLVVINIWETCAYLIAFSLDGNFNFYVHSLSLPLASKFIDPVVKLSKCSFLIHGFHEISHVQLCLLLLRHITTFVKLSTEFDLIVDASIIWVSIITNSYYFVFRSTLNLQPSAISPCDNSKQGKKKPQLKLW